MNKTTGNKSLVIIPAYNEQKRIGDIVSRIKYADPDIDVAVIDDGSADETAYLAERSGARVIRHLSNMGYGAALQSSAIRTTLRMPSQSPC